MVQTDKVKTTVYISVETWDSFIAWMIETYGHKVKVTSITFEQALKEFLDRQQSPTT